MLAQLLWLHSYTLIKDNLGEVYHLLLWAWPVLAVIELDVWFIDLE